MISPPQFSSLNYHFSFSLDQRIKNYLLIVYFYSLFHPRERISLFTWSDIEYKIV